MGTYYLDTLLACRILNGSEVAQAADDTDVTDWTKTDPIIMAVLMACGSAKKDPTSANVQLRWRNVTDGGSFANLGATGECKYTTATSLSNDATYYPAKTTTAGGWSLNTAHMKECEDGLLTGIDIGADVAVEDMFAIDLSDGHDGDEYEFQVYDTANSQAIGTCLATLTLGIITNEEATAEEAYHLLSDNDGSPLSLTQLHDLAVAEAYSLLDDNDGNPLSITQTHSLDVAEAYHLLDDNDGNPIGVSVNFIMAMGADPYHLLDDNDGGPLTLTQTHTLDISESSHLLDDNDGAALALTQVHELAVDESYHLLDDNDGSPLEISTHTPPLEVADCYHEIYDEDEFLLFISEITNDFSQYTGTTFPDWTDTDDTSVSTVVEDPPVYSVGDQAMSLDADAVTFTTLKKDWEAPGSFLNGEVLFRINPNIAAPQPANGANWFGVIVRHRYVGGVHYGLGVSYSFSSALESTFAGNRWDSTGTPWTFDQDNYDYDVMPSDAWYFVRVNISQDATTLYFKAKYWRDTLPEPTGWQIEQNRLRALCDAEILKAGKVAIFGYTLAAINDYTRLIDVIGVNTTGATVPLPALPWTPIVVAEAAHTLVDEGPISLSLTSSTSLTVAEADHLHDADGLELTEVIDLAVAECAHEHDADALALTQAHDIAVDEAYHLHEADNAAISSNVILEVAEGAHLHEADSLDLVQIFSLEVAEAAHLHEADNLALDQLHALSVAECAHEQAAEGLLLVQEHSLAVAESDHLTDSDQLTLSGAGALAVAEADHLHSADTLDLSQVHTLEISEAAHVHEADNLALSVIYALAVAESYHEHAADNLTVQTGSILAVDAAYHAHEGEQIALTQVHELAVDEAAHDTTSDQISLGGIATLTVAEAAHEHTCEALTLALVYVMTVADSAHLHEADGLVLGVVAVMTVDEAASDHVADAIVLTQEHSLAVNDGYSLTVNDRVTLVSIATTFGLVYQTMAVPLNVHAIIDLTPERQIVRI